MQNFRNLQIWKRSYNLTLDIYKITNNFPSEEKFGLVSQIRRAALSIPSNIAEGSAKSSRKDFLRFLEISIGSICEIETQLEISRDLEYIDELTFQRIRYEILEIKKMTTVYISKARKDYL